MPEEFGAHSAERDPLKLFLPDPDRHPSWVHDKLLPFLGASLGFSYFCFTNLYSRRPAFAGGYRHIIGAIGGGVFGYYWHFYREERMAEYNSMIQWYIEQHPSSFPKPERVKVGELLKDWYPAR